MIQQAKPKPKFTAKTVFLPLIGLLAFFLYIWFFNVDLVSIIETVKQVQPLPYLAAIAVSFIEILFYSLSWRSILSSLNVKISKIKSYIYVCAGLFMDILIPAESVSGEVCRMYLVNREQKGVSGKVVASLMTYRLLSMVMNAAFLVLGGVLLFGVVEINPLVSSVIQLFTGLTVGLMALFLGICWKENWTLKIVNFAVRGGDFLSRGRLHLDKYRQDALNATKSFHDSMKDLLRNPSSLVAPTFYLALNWAASMIVCYLVFISLGFDVSWGVVLITTSLVTAIKSIPVGIPFEVGLPEITMTTLYVSLGVPADIAATSTILSRLITLWLRFIIGFAAYQWTETKHALAKACVDEPVIPLEASNQQP
ncbi:MAG: lysylphosphatidylglycerol synthase transmembrane domain-containing protein [Candidatus Bathyarchaeia archaeon]